MNPNGWAPARLQDIATIIDPNPKHRNPKYISQGFPFISTAEFIEPEGILIDSKRRVSEDTVIEQEQRCNFSLRSIFFSRKGTIGKVRMHPGGRLALLDSLCVINPNDLISSRFLMLALRSSDMQASIEAVTRGVALRQISVGEVRELTVPIAPANEQQRIVGKLDAFFERSHHLRSELYAIASLIEQFRRAVLSAATTGKLTEGWVRSRASREPWRMLPLHELCYSFDYGTAAKSHSSGSVAVLRMGNLQSGKIDWTDLAYTSDAAEIKKYSLKPKTVLFNRTNSPDLVGKTAIYNGEHDAIFAGYLIRINHKEILDPDYLNYCLNSPMAREYFWRVKSDGVSQSNINAQKLGNLPFPYCSKVEQQEIVRRIAALFAKADAMAQLVSEAHARVDLAEQAVLARAFRGELVLQDPNDEPASVLLERIRAERAALETLKTKNSQRRQPHTSA